MVKRDRQAYLVCMEGGATLKPSKGSDIVLERHDATEIYGDVTFVVTAGATGAHLIVYEMAMDPEGGRGDL